MQHKLLNFILLSFFICIQSTVFTQPYTSDGINPEKVYSDQVPVMTFKERHIDLGKVKKGENISFTYHFTNEGEVDIAIDFASGCDCTELDWPVKSFKPGESGHIEVVFLSGKKEENETVEIDLWLKNVDPSTQNPILVILTYSYEFK